MRLRRRSRDAELLSGDALAASVGVLTASVGLVGYGLARVARSFSA